MELKNLQLKFELERIKAIDEIYDFDIRIVHSGNVVYLDITDHTYTYDNLKDAQHDEGIIKRLSNYIAFDN